MIPGSQRSPGEGNGNTLQYSYLENPMDIGAWWGKVHGVAKELDTTERLTLSFLHFQDGLIFLTFPVAHSACEMVPWAKGICDN